MSQAAQERDVLDRLVVRVPTLAGVTAGVVLRVQPGSALRRALINLQVKRVLAAHATQWLMRVAAAAFR